MKRILLTGATGGIGRHIAQALAAAGHQLLLVARNEEALGELAAVLPGQHRILALDLTAEQAPAQLQAACQDGLDVLINNAGSNQLAAFVNTPWTDIERQLQLNLWVPMRLCHALVGCLPTGGQIINIGSVLGEIGYPGYVTYGAAKGGLKRFSEALGRELSDQAIEVSYLAPRATDTPLNSPAAKALNKALGNQVDPPERVGSAVAELVSKPRRYRVIGFPESLFVRINAVLPAVVGGAISKQLGTIKAHFKEPS